MKVYTYNDEGIYNGELDAQKDQLETKAQGVDVFLLPANATFKEPPTLTDKQIAVFNSDDWVITEDKSKNTYYDKDTAKIVELNPLDEVADNLTEDVPPETFPKWNGTTWEEDIEAKKDYNLRLLSYECTKYIYDNIGDPHKQSKYLGRFCELQEKRIDGETLTASEITERDGLKDLHKRYKAILVEHDVFEGKINNDEEVNIIFTQ